MLLHCPLLTPMQLFDHVRMEVRNGDGMWKRLAKLFISFRKALIMRHIWMIECLTGHFVREQWVQISDTSMKLWEICTLTWLCRLHQLDHRKRFQYEIKQMHGGIPKTGAYNTGWLRLRSFKIILQMDYTDATRNCNFSGESFCILTTESKRRRCTHFENRV